MDERAWQKKSRAEKVRPAKTRMEGDRDGKRTGLKVAAEDELVTHDGKGLG